MIPKTRSFEIANGVSIGGRSTFVLFAGPCIAESRELLFEVAGSMQEMCTDLNIPYVFKSSFDKANRSSISGYRGPGVESFSLVIQEVKKELNLPIITDVHLPEQCSMVAEVADVLQIPAFMSTN